MERAVYNHIAQVLRDYPDIPKYVHQREDEIEHPWHEGDGNVGGGRSNVPGKPVESMAITIASDRRLTALENNRRVVDKCLSQADSETVTIIYELYIKKRPMLTVEGVASKVHLSPSQVRRRRQRFFECMADEFGW